MIAVPRIQGRVGQIEAPPELAGKWVFSLWMSFVGDGQEPRTLLENIGPYPTRDIAMAQLRLATKRALDATYEAAGMKPTGDYVDLKDNRTKNFNDES